MSDSAGAPVGAEIAGFWRRSAAALIDALVLAVPAYVIGYQFFDQLAALGQNARFIGASAALLYFGLLNSSVGNGQTPGKRMLGIRVVGASGEPISVPRSAARWFILALPFYLNGMDLTPFVGSDDAHTVMMLGVVVSAAVFGLGGAIVYLFVFNRKTRQSLHDLMLETYVVRARSSGAVGAHVWPVHVAIALAFVATGLALPAALQPLAHTLVPDGTYAALLDLERDLEAHPGVERVVVTTETMTIASATRGTSTTSYLVITIYLSKRIDDPEPLIMDAARSILKREPELLGNDQLRIAVVAAFDVGIVQARETTFVSNTAEGWRQKLRGDAAGQAIEVRHHDADAVTSFVMQVWGLFK